MKKIFLLLTLGSVAFSLQAQVANRSVLFSSSNNAEQATKLKVDGAKDILGHTLHANQQVANKTTAGPTQRWYNYGDYMDTMLRNSSLATGVSGVIIWNDTLGRVLYSSGIGNNNMVSVGSILQPQVSGFNDPAYYPGAMLIDNSKAYNIDSIRMYGNFNIAPLKSGVVDTFILTTLKGTNLYQTYYLGMMTDYGHDTLFCADINYDSVKNTASNGGGPAVTTVKIPINAAMRYDTLPSGTFVLRAGVNISAAAGEFVAVSLSFKSGDASFPTVAPGDTLESFGASAPKYNSFYPWAIFKEAGANTDFAPYTPGDYNEGLYKTLPSYENGYAVDYVPMWAWTSGGGASYLQHIYMDWRANCTNCSTVGVNEVVKNITSVNAYPNPATSQLNVNFNVLSATDVTVTLTNTVGQVIATQNVNNATSGTATFNTAKIATGVYFYTVIANGERSTGRVVVAN